MEKMQVIDQDGQKYYLPVSTYKNLYDHQQVALKWLLGLFARREGGLLCDEMGLGKTISIVSFLSCLNWTLEQLEKNVTEPQNESITLLSRKKSAHLLITPVTIMKQWKAELIAWDPIFFTSNNIWILHESADIKTRQKIVKKAQTTRGVLIISYELARIYEQLFFKKEWNYIILDEGQKIKNPYSQTTQVCQKIKGLNRIILTGTPIQNDVRELWSLFDFACPGYLGDLQTFEKDF